MEEFRVPTNRHLNHLPAPSRIADLVFGVVCIDKTSHDATAFENMYVVAVGMSVCQSGNSAVRVDGREPRGFLLVGGHVYFVHLVGKTEFGQSDADFYAIWGLGYVEG